MITRKKVNVVIGRFQPFTIGHLEMSKQLLKENDLPCVYVYIRSKSGKNSIFSDNLTQRMLEEVEKKYSHIIDTIQLQYAFIPGVVGELQRLGYEPVFIGAGPDRYEEYQKQLSRANKELVLDEDFRIFPFKTRFSGVSGTQVREFIKNDDFDGFSKNTPMCIHNFYGEFKKELSVNENLEIDLDVFFNGEVESVKEGRVGIDKKILHSTYQRLTNMLKDNTDKKKLHDIIEDFFKEKGFEIF